MNVLEWPRISFQRIAYGPVALSCGATIIVVQCDMQSKIPLCYQGLLWFAHLLILLSVSIGARTHIRKNLRLFDSPLIWRYILALTYSTLPLFFSVILYIIFYQTVPDPLSLYLVGLLCIFGGITALLIAPAIPQGEISREYLEKLYSEALQIIWPYTFAFILTLTASPFVGQSLTKLATVSSLLATIWLGIIGFISLIILPLSNLSEIREEMRRRGFL